MEKLLKFLGLLKVFDSFYAKFYFFKIFLLGFYYIMYTVLQCELPPLRPHCGEALGLDSNPDREAQRQGHYP